MRAIKTRPGLAVTGIALVAVVVIVGVLASWPFKTPEDWTAAAAWVTAFVAIAAAVVGLGQLAEARRVRLEQSQPYVVIFMEPSRAGTYFIDLVVRNFGTTAAYDVRVKVD